MKTRPEEEATDASATTIVGFLPNIFSNYYLFEIFSRSHFSYTPSAVYLTFSKSIPGPSTSLSPAA